ncbi:hypothetical protein [Caballeronia sp. dw_276]|nr:hypothetical protein [Caballeronia sp. dw_276]
MKHTHAYGTVYTTKKTINNNERMKRIGLNEFYEFDEMPARQS